MLNLLAQLKRQFNPARADTLDATIEFRSAQGSCYVSVRDGQATFYDALERAPEVELVLYFRDEQQAIDIVQGAADPIAAFLQGDFRSNGYIIWVFQTLSAFSSSTA